MELFGLASWQGLLLIVLVSGVISFGVTQLLKLLYSEYIKHTPEEDKEPWYWNVELKALAILLGAAVGSCFTFVGVEFVFAITLGLVGGILNTLIIKTIREKVKQAKINVADEELPEKQDGE